MEIGETFRARIEERVGEALAKYFDGGSSGHVTVSKSTVSKTGARFSADCTLHLDTGLTLQTTGTGSEPMPAFEAAADRLETRLRRYKRRLKSHATSPAETTDIAYRVVEAFSEDEEDEVPEDYAPAIVAESSVSLKTMSVASAVVELDAKDSPVLVFRNSASQGVNVVYRRPDGNIGWIDPNAAAPERGEA